MLFVNVIWAQADGPHGPAQSWTIRISCKRLADQRLLDRPGALRYGLTAELNCIDCANRDTHAGGASPSTVTR